MTTLTSKITADTTPNIKKMINHIIFLIDGSGSMGHHLQTVKKVFDSTLAQLKSTNTLDQELFLSVYQFDQRVNRIVFNEDIKKLNANISFSATGLTALRDAVDRSISDHNSLKLNKDEDHTFLLYCITDGADNASRVSSSLLKSVIGNLSDDWTVVALVPTATDVYHAKSAGFPAGNIQIWDANNSQGFEEVGRQITQSYSNYSVGRSTGVRSTSNIFSVNTADVKRADVRGNLTEVKGRLYHAQNDYIIKDMVEKFTNKDYVKGSTFYELSKLELVQTYKEIVIVSKKDDKKFGGKDARDLLGLPSHDTKMKPGDFGDWRIFIQSTSVNRKIKAGTSIFVTE